MRTVPDPIPADLTDRHAATYEYALLELGYPAEVEACCPHGVMLAGANLPDDDTRYFLANVARAALGLETWRDRDYWQGITDSLNAAKEFGITAGIRRNVHASGETGWGTHPVGSSSFTITRITSMSVVSYQDGEP